VRGLARSLAKAALALAAASAAFATAAEVSMAGELAYTSFECDDGGPCTRSVWAARDDGTSRRRLTASSPAHLGGHEDPTWSPDGRTVAFASFAGGGGNGLFAVSASGGPTRRILPREVEAFRPAWSPRGDAIAFASRYAGPVEGVPDDPGPDGPNSGPDTDIFLVSPDGSRLRRIVGGPGREDRARFSDDGHRLTFFREGAADGALPGLGDDTGWYSVAADGGDERRLTVGSAPLPVYSPDGRFIALGTAYHELFTMRADGSDVRYWPRGSDYRFDWGSAGPTLYFNGLASGGASRLIGKIDFSGATPRGEILPFGPAVLGVDWTDGSGAAPVRDDSAPATLLLGPRQRPLGFSAARPDSASATSRRRRAPVVARSRLGFAAVDGTGVRRIETAVGRIGRRGRCRFLGSRSYGRLRPCRRPIYREVRSGPEWRRRVRRLRRGRHVIRFRAEDVAANRSVRRRIVRLR
jgi:hypothetical protein